MSYLGDIFKDEQGTPSLGRYLVTGIVIFAAWFTVQDIRGREVGDSIYNFWQPIILTMIAWGAGPRLAQYLAPIAIAAVQRVRGAFSSSYREVEQTTVVDDDPVKDV